MQTLAAPLGPGLSLWWWSAASAPAPCTPDTLPSEADRARRVSKVLPLFATDMGLGASGVGLILSTSALSRVALNLPLGRLADKSARPDPTRLLSFLSLSLFISHFRHPVPATLLPAGSAASR